MYRYYKKDIDSVIHDVMYYYFDSISEFLDYIDNTVTSSGFYRCNLASMKTSNNEWSGTSSLQEAEELAKYGYNADFKKFLELKNKLERYIKLSEKKDKQYNWYVGYAPDVKAYLEGNPLSMFNKINPIRKQIDIYFNTSYNCGTDTQQIYNRGVITLSVADVLEKLGFIVNLNIFSMTYEASQIHYAVFRLKNTNERINIKKLFFPMCHNSWLRRLITRLMEETPDIKSYWVDGYGVPADENMIRKIIDLKPNDIVITQPSEMGIFGNDLIKDANNMFDFINHKRNTEDFELPHLKKNSR